MGDNTERLGEKLKRNLSRLLVFPFVALVLFSSAFSWPFSHKADKNGNNQNGGLCIEAGGELYYSDRDVVYVEAPTSNLVRIDIKGNSFTQRIVSAGDYVDLTYFQKELYCLEAPQNSYTQLVRFNIKTSEKEVLFPELKDLDILGVANDNLYLTEWDYSQDNLGVRKLYHITSNGELVADNVLDPLFVSEDGVFVNSNPDSNDGLKLVSEEGVEIYSFRCLRGVEIWRVLFVDGDFLYARIRTPGVETDDILKLDMRNDNYVVITESIKSQLPSYMQLNAVNYCNDSLYMAYYPFTDIDQTVPIYKTDMNGENIQYLCDAPIPSNSWSINFLDSSHFILTDAWTHEWFLFDVDSCTYMTRTDE